MLCLVLFWLKPVSLACLSQVGVWNAFVCLSESYVIIASKGWERSGKCCSLLPVWYYFKVKYECACRFFLSRPWLMLFWMGLHLLSTLLKCLNCWSCKMKAFHKGRARKKQFLVHFSTFIFSVRVIWNHNDFFFCYWKSTCLIPVTVGFMQFLCFSHFEHNDWEQKITIKKYTNNRNDQKSILMNSEGI